MEEITSRRHWKKFYLNVFLLTLYFLWLAAAVGLLYKEALSLAGEIFIILICLCLVIMALYTIIRYFKNAPEFCINTVSLTFNRKGTFFWKDLERIQMSGKWPFKFMLDYPREGMMLKFTGSKEIYVYDDMYANTAALKQFISHHIFNKPCQQSIILKKDKPAARSSEQFVWYKGSQWFSFRGVVLSLTLAFLLYAIIVASNAGLMMVMFCIGIVCFLIFSGLVYYFGISDNYFVVQNPNLIWIRTKYRLNDIQEVVFEQQHSKMPYSLRIVTKDFESNLYMAGALRRTTWKQLQNDLENRNIKVRNECIF